MEKDAFRCVCENKNGKGIKNGILCGIADDTSGVVVGGFHMISNCEENEWCIGPNSSNDSVRERNYAKESLCSKGEQRDQL